MKFFVVFMALLLAAPVFAEKRAMTVEDLWDMQRIVEVALSPDGKTIAYSVTAYDMEKNTGHTDVWLVSASGGQPRQLTTAKQSSSMPRWTPDGKAILFLSSHEGSSQIFKILVDGGQVEQLTHFPVDVNDFILSPDGNKIAFSAQVYADAPSLAQSAEKDKQRQDAVVQARVIDKLYFRSWDRWTDGKHNHIFVCDINGANVVDKTPGDFDAPPLDLGGHFDYTFSPDGKELAFVSNHTDMPAANTNNDVFLVAENGTLINLTETNAAVDNQPAYSPDGRCLVYKAMARPGFEADKYNIVLYDRIGREKIILTEALDLSAEEVVWSPDNKTLFFNAEEQGRKTIYSLDVQTKKLVKLVDENFNSDLLISPDGKTLFFKRQSAVMPNEIFAFDINKGAVRQITFVNQNLLSQLEMNPVEYFWFDSFDGKKAPGLLVKPPFFDAAQKYPLMFLIHGGPQGMWSDDFHYRWNLSLFAAPGYVVVAINPRGSRGYGQDWCDAVSKDWGGAPYRDLMTGLDYALAAYTFIDSTKMAAAGASYGGFMINWITTHTDRFDALVCHDGVFDQFSMYGATEELWFPEWEFGGTPYENPELYDKWSPSRYVANLKKFQTPTLIIHGEKDFRVPVTQGFQAFTALQRMGVPSRLICFPDENHFVLKPQNARLWWTEVFAWVERWINADDEALK